MTPPRAFDLLLAGSILFWGSLGWLEGPSPANPVGLAMLALQLCVAVLLVTRQPETRAAPASALALASPAVLIGAVVLGAAPPRHAWSIAEATAFVAGSALACVSLASLGRSFAILPGLRRVVRRGPYRLVRHPAYLGEGLMLLAAAWAIGGGLGLALVVFAAGALHVRIVVEERVLFEDPLYRDYADSVRWRVLPMLW